MSFRLCHQCGDFPVELSDDQILCEDCKLKHLERCAELSRLACVSDEEGEVNES